MPGTTSCWQASAPPDTQEGQGAGHSLSVSLALRHDVVAVSPEVTIRRTHDLVGSRAVGILGHGHAIRALGQQETLVTLPTTPHGMSWVLTRWGSPGVAAADLAVQGADLAERGADLAERGADLAGWGARCWC